MIEQDMLAERLRHVCSGDQTLVAAVLAGSFALGEADRYSDLDAVLFVRDEALPDLNHRAWIEQVAPIALFFPDEFGHYTAIFTSLVRAEFSFKAASTMAAVLESWRGNAWFPDPGAAILLDRTGELLKHISRLRLPVSPRDTPEQVATLAHNLSNYLLFGASVLARGEVARALGMLDSVHPQLLRLARLLEGATVHWPTPSRLVEWELSEQRYARFAACTAALDRQALWRAYRESLTWGHDMIEELAERHRMPIPLQVLDQLGAAFDAMESEART